MNREDNLTQLGEKILACFMEYVEKSKTDSKLLADVFMLSRQKITDPAAAAQQVFESVVTDGFKVMDITKRFLSEKLIKTVEERKDAKASRRTHQSDAQGT